MPAVLPKMIMVVQPASRQTESVLFLFFYRPFLFLPFCVQIDILLNNGGRSQRSLCLETDLDVYQALMELNYLGTVSLVKCVLPHLVERKRGQIVTISSVAGLAGVPLASGYSASKHALQVR